MSLAQTDSTQRQDSLRSESLQEVIVIGQRSLYDNSTKPLATLDNYLEKSGAVNMIRRGSYAWEPFLNGMATERSVITIDGMRIYAACTDKMDPITSYVEITNLAKANIHSGSAGSTGGSTIAGTLDLVRKRGSFGQSALNGMAFSGFETNNKQKIFGGALNYSHPKFFSDVDFTIRDASNYRAGGGEEIQYSQFTKYNISAQAGYKLKEHQQIEASLIYDKAVNVGYPALPMDVSLAKAIIGSVSYTRHHKSPLIYQWQTKLYYNDVKHVMDDTKRPNVPIRMDMPGWSKTAGFYSILQGTSSRHDWKANISGHYNKSLAEMTMFSNTSNERDMFMLTWPGVKTYYGDLFFEDNYSLSDKWNVALSAGLAVHNNNVDNQFGLESLRIFYPEMTSSRTRFLKRLSASIKYDAANWIYTFGTAYGERAPSVSEGYGFYLFNSFDRFDYIGNPNMYNERSKSINASMAYKKASFTAKFSGSYFYINNYILGRPRSDLSVMTIGGNGVKVYEQLKYAVILNTSLDVGYQITKELLWTSQVVYRRGTGENGLSLPLMQPFTYNSVVSFTRKSFSADASVNGSTSHTKYNSEFGEKGLPAYAIFNLSFANRFKLDDEQALILKTGVENLFDRNYTTFADWNRIPRIGRNFFINLIWNF
ncbi:TonB-dependent receptor plug domain-containing protein [Sphingobacterium spiritivorum]|uniref:TonB-dependent receptor plug domain-containing protein n=1 Tax=Sphingobacterium spiritivorum TaxID=258 RepID=UPI003DA53DD7